MQRTRHWPATGEPEVERVSSEYPLFLCATVTATATFDEPVVSASPGMAFDPAWQERARGLIGDLFRRSAAIYWTDLLLSSAAAWALTVVYFTAPAWSALQVFAFLGASVLFFRVGTFIHEIVHMPGGQMMGFKRAWNVLLGIPLLAICSSC